MKKVLLIGLSLLFASSAMAEESQYHCDDVLVKAVSKDKTKALRICESDNRIASTLFNLTDNTIIFDRLSPKSWVRATVGKQSSNIMVMTYLGNDGNENEGFMFFYHPELISLRLVKPEEKVLFLKPTINKINQNLSAKGIYVYEN